MKNIYVAGETVTLYMNLYRAGWFHRANKPGTIDIHPGDFYTDYTKAVSEIDRPELYMGTIPFEYTVPEDTILKVNAADAVAIPLAVSRREHMKKMLEKGVDIRAEMLAANALTEAHQKQAEEELA